MTEGGRDPTGSCCDVGEEVTPADDPWAHRSKGMRCSTCMWFVLKRAPERGPLNEIGRCRRHAPTMSGYPVVFTTDWCGDHKLDETKVSA